MKAILVIDVPVDDTTDFGHMDIRADVKVKAYNDLDFKSYELKHIRVEPIPQKKQKDNSNELNFGYELGYNACIDEILGDEK